MLPDLLELVALYQKHCPTSNEEVLTFIEDIDLDFIKEDLSKLLSSMKIGTERIRQIVLTLRNFSRLNEAELKLVNIHEGIDSTLLILQNRLKEKTAHPAISVLKEYATLPLIECYAGQLNQVFMNLLSNAIDAVHEKEQKLKENRKDYRGIITIRTEKISENDIKISIQDNGIGMTPSVQEKLFTSFFTTKK